MTKYTDKVCKQCGAVYTPTGKAQRFCCSCGAKRQRESIDRYRVRHGVSVGVGSGNLQRGERNPAWKGGASTYRQVKLSSLGPDELFCERCHKDLSQFIQDKTCFAQWTVHHKDRNRRNVSLENLELLCKRCHQIEHDCTASLPNKG